ncbi:MAG: aldehyde dehydrogenase family protein, partial [Pseudomonadota bacterium]|nr:aldehyde dehydrogenase family protein [Pseudomonadota bacterium]
MTFTPHGKHLIAGQWVSSAQQFNSSPAHGDAFSFSVGSVDLVDQAVQAAESAFYEFSATSRAERAAFLNTIAEEIEAR